MEFTLFVIILVFVIILLNRVNRTSADTKNSIDKLQATIDDLKSQIFRNSPLSASSQDSEANKRAEIFPQSIVPEKKIPEKIVLQEIKKPEEETPKEIVERIVFSSKTERLKSEKTENPISESVFEEQKLPPQKSWVEKFKENNPDIEKFIGENLINKIGILILVLGISFFVKYAIDKDWINEPARVGIGILCGALVMFVAHKLKANYKAFSSVFVAGAVGIFYLTIGIAFHDYHLFSQTVAFIIMVVITAFSALVSVSYNRKELAILTLIGGFAVPFMVSSGDGNYKILFSYIIILNLGMLIIAYFKKWNLVTILAFVFTCILYSAWFSQEYYNEKFPHLGAFIFAAIFYMIFSIAIVINNLRNKNQFSKVDYALFLANTFFFFGIGLSIIESWGISIKGLFTVVLALYNFILAFIFYKKYGLAKNAIYLLLGLVLSFITLAIPIQFEGNYITLFWAAEAVLLFWMAKKSNISTLKFAGIAVQIFMLISLFMDWDFYYLGYSDLDLKPVINKVFITGVVSLVSLVITTYFFKNEKENNFYNFIKFHDANYRSFLLILSVFVTYFVGYFEIFYQSQSNIANETSAISLAVLYHYIFSAVLIYFSIQNKRFVGFSLVLALVNILAYITLFYDGSFQEMANNFAGNTSTQMAFITHYVVLICLFYFLFVLYKNRSIDQYSKFLNHKFALWILAFFVVYILSNEVMIHSLKFSGDIVTEAELANHIKVYGNDFYERRYFFAEQASVLKTQIIKIGYPILWGILSFLFLIVGIKKQNKQLRIIALSLLGITILKLFLYDIKNVSETGKIIAFILLGVLILIISFVYQRLKKLVIDDSKLSKPNDDA